MGTAGLHVIMDVSVDDVSVFTAENFTKMFTDLVDILDMKILHGPIFKEVPVSPEIHENVKKTGVFADEGGVTGFVIINCSHISAHSFNVSKVCSIDVFSCKDFDAEKAINFIKSFLNCTKANVKIVDRDHPE